MGAKRINPDTGVHEVEGFWGWKTDYDA